MYRFRFIQQRTRGEPQKIAAQTQFSTLPAPVAARTDEVQHRHDNKSRNTQALTYEFHSQTPGRRMEYSAEDMNNITSQRRQGDSGGQSRTKQARPRACKLTVPKSMLQAHTAAGRAAAHTPVVAMKARRIWWAKQNDAGTRIGPSS